MTPPHRRPHQAAARAPRHQLTASTPPHHHRPAGRRLPLTAPLPARWQPPPRTSEAIQGKTTSRRLPPKWTLERLSDPNPATATRRHLPLPHVGRRRRTALRDTTPRISDVPPPPHSMASTRWPPSHSRGRPGMKARAGVMANLPATTRAAPPDRRLPRPPRGSPGRTAPQGSNSAASLHSCHPSPRSLNQRRADPRAPS